MNRQTFHFISGLPRSGSTLLAALLRQNPRLHAGTSSPVAALVAGMRQQFSAGSEFGAVITPAERKRLVRALFDAYYAEHTDKAVIFDTSRMWAAHLPMLMDQFPGAKVIACVRNVGWIMDSIERRYRADPYDNTRLFSDEIERNTVYSRVDTLAQRNRLVGNAWSALKEAFYGEHAASLLLVDYDLLAKAPHKVMPLIYQFLGERPFEHDFDRLDVDAEHEVRARVAFEPRESILPPDLFAQHANLSFWKNAADSRANVISEQPAPTPGAVP